MALRRLRLVLVVVTLVVLETTVFTHLEVFGAAPMLCLVATSAMSFEEGPQTAAAFGFASGIFLDLFLASPLGLSALAFAVTGYVLGIFQGGFVRDTRSIAPLLGAAATLLGGAIFVVVGGIVGEDGYLTLTSGRIVIVSALYGGLVAYLVFPFLRWANHDPDRARPWR